MDVHEREARRLIAAGADPRQAGPAAAAYFGLPRALNAREILVIGTVLGVVICVAAVAVVMLAFELRLTSADTVRIASAVRAAVQGADDLSQSDLTARLTQTSEPNEGSTSRQIEDALSSIPVSERMGMLTDLLKLTPLLHNPVALKLVRTLWSLPDSIRGTLVHDDRLGPLMVWTADLTTQQQDALLASNLKAVLGDADRFDLLQILPGLDPLAARVLRAWNVSAYSQRQTLMTALSIINQADDRFERVVAAFRYASPSLMQVLNGRLLNCTFANRGACQ